MLYFCRVNILFDTSTLYVSRMKVFTDHLISNYSFNVEPITRRLTRCLISLDANREREQVDRYSDLGSSNARHTRRNIRALSFSQVGVQGSLEHGERRPM